MSKRTVIIIAIEMEPSSVFLVGRCQRSYVKCPFATLATKHASMEIAPNLIRVTVILAGLDNFVRNVSSCQAVSMETVANHLNVLASKDMKA